MLIGKTLYITERKKWRDWLIKNHNSTKEIWLVTYKKHTGKPTLSYNDAVEEALCFGWIDSIVKRIDEDKTAQRFSPRKPKSVLSEMNKERIRRLIAQKKMTKAGLAAIAHAFDPKKDLEFVYPSDILKKLKVDQKIWQNYQNFPESYKRIRIGWIDGARSRPEEFEKRLNYFLKMTAKNSRFGIVQ